MSLARQQLLAASGQGGPPASASSHGRPPASSPVPPAVVIQQHLEQLPNEQLEKLLTDEEAFKEFTIKIMSDAPATKALNDIVSRNRALAQENIDLQGAIDEARNHLAVVKSSEFSAARSTFAELQARQQEVLNTLAPSALLQAINKDADEADEKSGQQLDAFLAGGVGLESFVEQYVAQRTAFHMLDLRRQAAQHHLTGMT